VWLTENDLTLSLVGVWVGDAGVRCQSSGKNLRKHCYVLSCGNNRVSN
jgi:hypothetical protein